MLDVLLESRAPRTRRVGSTVASALLHAGLFAGAVALTMPGPVDGRAAPPPEKPIWLAPPQAVPATEPGPRQGSSAPTAPGLPPTIAPPDVVPDGLPPIDIGPAIPPDEVVIGNPGVRAGSPLGTRGAPPLGASAVMDERLVDRAPALTGRVIEPRYPAPLREAGVQGRVVVQFVVDTTGRAEVDGLQVLESAHPQFLESVREALGRYRFTVGEAAGRKVRTRVQMPFAFALVR